MGEQANNQAEWQTSFIRSVLLICVSTVGSDVSGCNSEHRHGPDRSQRSTLIFT